MVVVGLLWAGQVVVSVCCSIAVRQKWEEEEEEEDVKVVGAIVLVPVVPMVEEPVALVQYRVRPVLVVVEMNVDENEDMIAELPKELSFAMMVVLVLTVALVVAELHVMHVMTFVLNHDSDLVPLVVAVSDDSMMQNFELGHVFVFVFVVVVVFSMVVVAGLFFVFSMLVPM